MRTPLLLMAAAAILLGSCKRSEPEVTSVNGTVATVLDSVMTRLYAKISPEQFASVNDSFMMSFLTDQEKQVLATRYQYFNVNVPVTVSLMRDQAQAHVPFWLEPSGFKKTDMLVKNEEYTYEVWQKDFDKGLVELGVNGFDKHRPVYFVSVAPKDKGASLSVTGIYPSIYNSDTLRVGAFTYHDWSGLELTEVPEALQGQLYFTTVRGRAREAHVIDAFRATPHPSSEKPDEILLTWSESPKTSINVQWRNAGNVNEGFVRYWKKGSKDTTRVDASKLSLDDRLLYNDRYVNRFTAALKGLNPGTNYQYQAGAGSPAVWSDVASFTTEPEGLKPFSFVWFGDTHYFPDSGKIVTRAMRENPDAAFYSVAGDNVSTGLYRDEWDRYFYRSGVAFANKPLMPTPGNHDRQDGLGAKLYTDLFALPVNNPDGVDPELSYYFEYGDALFIMIDATSDVDDHTPWIDKVLSGTKAKWKFVMFHFPPYNFEEPYLDIQKEWVPLFDKYHVDMVMGGHIHYYMRSKPMNAGKVVDDYSKGTAYAISISIPSKHEHLGPEPYAVKQYPEGYFYQRVEIGPNEMRYKAVDSEGVVRDQFAIKK
ncbi:metallophosphoesterase family protein [Chryseolinea sp. T2]|uniref:metallophosphoesterase family protein n=1 Tax=Chryseolinea sp. T2 TaxID=3129255 RepID=UPI003078A618